MSKLVENMRFIAKVTRRYNQSCPRRVHVTPIVKDDGVQMCFVDASNNQISQQHNVHLDWKMLAIDSNARLIDNWQGVLKAPWRDQFLSVAEEVFGEDEDEIPADYQ